jgi:hypothetical protein
MSIELLKLKHAFIALFLQFLIQIESRPLKQRPLRVVDDSNEGSAK